MPAYRPDDAGPSRPPPEAHPQADPEALNGLLARPEALVDLVAGALSSAAASLDQQQAVHGIDAWSELEFHPVAASGLEAAGLGVAREAVYPGQIEHAARRRAKRAERERCDLVVLPRRDATLLDPVSRLIERADVEATLFAPVVERVLVPQTGVPPEEALWLEIKVAGQFCFTDDWSGPNRAWSSELTRATLDLDKLAADPHIRRGALLLVLFTADRRIADHDLRMTLDRASERSAPMLSPSVARFPIADRIGNQLCTLAWIPAACHAGEG